MSNVKKCFICLRDAKERCSFCSGEVWFCCPAHKLLHRDESVRKNCFPIKILSQPGVGRYMVASDDIKAGEILYAETPIVVGPNPVSTAQCLFCYKKIDLSHRCAGCAYPICSEELCHTENKEFHQKYECKILQKLENKQELEALGGEKKQFANSVYEPIVPLRLLLLRETNPDSFAVANTFMDHDSDRKNTFDYWDHSTKTVMQPLAKALGDKATIEDIAKCVGIVEINNYEIFNCDQLTGYRGVYPLTSIMSHSCRPNCRPIMQKTDNCESVCIATVDIAKGEELTINYVHLHLTTSERRKTLRENWYFECSCQRCSDPTELKTFLGAIKCKKCSSTLLSKDPLDNDSIWTCQGCQTTEKSEVVSDIVANLLKKKEKIPKTDLQAYFKFLDHCGKIVGENHSIINSVRRWIIPLYCRRTSPKDYQIPTAEMYKKKIEMCKKYLEVLNITEKGLTKSRGKTLFELADTSVSLSNHFYQRGMLSKELMISELDNSIQLLKESVGSLDLEDNLTFEGKIHSAGQQMIKQFLDFRQILQESQ